MTRAYANGRTIVHRGDGLVDVAGPPDVCKTPSPAGPVPVPYVNAARTADLAQGARRTEIDGSPVALASSYIVTSTGDEPGTAGGGVISGRIRGKLKWQSTSLDVRVEGKGVARFTDAVSHNGNTFNASFFQCGTGWAYGDDFEGPCRICNRSPSSHRVPEKKKSSLKQAQALYDALQAAYDDYRALGDERVALQGELDQLKAQLAAAGTSAAGPSTAGPSTAGPSTAPLDAKQRKALSQRIKDKGREVRGKQDEVGKRAVHKNRSTHGGYMIGVMVCECGKVFAAMSGQTLVGFKRVVEELGFTLCDQQAGVDDYIAANPRVDARLRVEERWDEAKNRNRNNEPFCNAPGVCAAAKLVTRSGGHVPRSMTEMFFAPLQPHRVDLRYRHYDRLHPFRVALRWLTRGRHGDHDVWREESFDPGVTVPSCVTCQSLVPLTLCDYKRRSCPR
ncbi:PAAR-like domain-containing protein [Nannocystis pusilla]|uniref:DUF4150 domain-containing protein n=1 Tax=Nannocystis pusilla TaxID=889268 RepID=A0ABS7U2J8_9BACT|nr:PAAR-like domain-containing protein [Nannocystis pusilla]MBZ5714680.1 DUF4150 domain-containing protein [Nannocystis pusilla]